MSSTTMIDIRRLNLRFGRGYASNQVLFDVELCIRKGEIFGLVGESGSGKTTVLKCLAGLFTQWSGELAIDGEPLAHGINTERCRRIQMVFQDPYGSLHPRHTVAQILDEPLAIHRIGQRRRRVEQMLDKVGLDAAFGERYPHQLSGGQRQRVAIARALILEPSVLLLDEPTSALDVSVQAEILNLLADLQRQDGLTFLLVTHDLGVVAHLCHRLAVMRQGRIIETLDKQRLLNGGAQHDYTRMLIDASRQYTRELARRSAMAG